MINQRFINEAIRIREEYLRTLENIVKEEDIISEYKSNIQELLNKNDKYVEDNKDKIISQVKEELKEELSDLDVNINKITNKLTPLFDLISKLEKESQNLFISIKEKHPNLTTDEIQYQIIHSIKR